MSIAPAGNENDQLVDVITFSEDWLDFGFDFEDGSDGTTSTLTASTSASNGGQSNEGSGRLEPLGDEKCEENDAVPIIVVNDGKAPSKNELVRKLKKRSARKITMVTPNMSRRGKYSILVAFPAFDKCDSLLFFPSTVTRLTNSADFAGLVKLCRGRFHKDCVSTYRDINFSFQDFMGLFEVVFNLYPDNLECVHETKVIDNTIVATTLAKYTDSNTIYKYVAKKMEGTLYQAMLPAKRADFLRNACFVDDSVKDAFVNSDLPDADVDFSVYATMTMRITFDDVRRKITRCDLSMQVTSIKPVEPVTGSSS